mmetsp:Transcript_45436/g.119345  ORF Transcript_45436/g.119345 Transcript_45436/m.119345 type:complete len:83 (-) Transcript_45436:638-886(-)
MLSAALSTNGSAESDDGGVIGAEFRPSAGVVGLAACSGQERCLSEPTCPPSSSSSLPYPRARILGESSILSKPLEGCAPSAS